MWMHQVTRDFEGQFENTFESYTEVFVLWNAILGSAETTFLRTCTFLHNVLEIAGQKHSILPFLNEKLQLIIHSIL